MAKTIGMGAKSEKANTEAASFHEGSAGLQGEMEKIRKEKKKALEENKMLKKEIDLLKKEQGEETQKAAEQPEGKA